MTYQQLQTQICNQTGSWVRAEDFGSAPVPEWTGWQSLSSVYGAPRFMVASSTSTALMICYLESLPIATKDPEILGEATKMMLENIEFVFGPSTSDMARILNVSRPMVYHYRAGMEPDHGNKRRLQAIAGVANEFRWVLKEPLHALLKAEQPEGRTLLDYLSDGQLDIPVVRRVVERSIKEADQSLRNRFADAMTKGQNAEERLDIVRERRKAGKPVIVSDPENPGRVIQILPRGRRIRGRIVKRRFVPDEE